MEKFTSKKSNRNLFRNKELHFLNFTDYSELP